MSEMIEVATALLQLPDGDLVFQRRPKYHWLNGGMLGLFGGHLEPEDNLDPETALWRELVEETTLDIGQLAIKRACSFMMPKKYMMADLWYHMHHIIIPSDDFEVKDGPGKEIYPVQGILQRRDLEPAIRYALKRTEL